MTPITVQDIADAVSYGREPAFGLPYDVVMQALVMYERGGHDNDVIAQIDDNGAVVILRASNGDE